MTTIARWMGIVISSPSTDVTYAIECGHLHIHMPLGTHDYPNDFRLSMATENATSPNTGQFRVLASYVVEATGASWAGVEARSGTFFVRGETLEPRTGAMGDFIVLRTESPTSPKTADGTIFGKHSIEMDRLLGVVVSQTVANYTFAVDSGQALASVPGYYPVVRAFVVGNDNKTGVTNNAIDVHLYSVQFCSVQ